MPNTLTYHQVTGSFYDNIDPDPAGPVAGSNPPRIQDVSAFVLLEYRLPENFSILIDDFDPGDGTPPSKSSVSFPSRLGRLMNGQLVTIDREDTDGVEMLSNSAILGLADYGVEQLIVDVSFLNETFTGNETGQLQNFAYTVPVDDSPVCLTDPDLPKLEWKGNVPLTPRFNIPDDLLATPFGQLFVSQANAVAALGVLGVTSYAKQILADADAAAVWNTLGTVPIPNLPNLAIIDYLGTVANQAAMLALTGQKGDWAIRSDTSTAWIISGSNPALLSSWTQLPFPSITWSNLSGRPAVVAAGADALAARQSVGAAPAGGTVYVQDYRVGSLTDDQILNAAITALPAGGKLVAERGHVYTLTATLIALLVGKDNAELDFAGATLSAPASVGAVFSPRGSRTSTTLTAAITTRASIITVASTAGVVAGDLIMLSSDSEVSNLDSGGFPNKIEVGKVKSVTDATTLVLEARTKDTYSLTGHVVTVYLYKPMRGITIRNLTVTGDGGLNGIGIQPFYFERLTLDNVTALNTRLHGIYPTEGIGFSGNNLWAIGCNQDALGYGFHCNCVDDVDWVNCHGFGNRHSFESHGSRNVKLTNVSACYDRSSGFSTHSVGMWSIENFMAYACGGGMIMRGTNWHVSNGFIFDTKTLTEEAQSYQHGIRIGIGGIAGGHAGENATIDNVYIDMGGPLYSSTSGPVGIYGGAALADVTMSNIYIRGMPQAGMIFEGDTNKRVTLRDITIDCSAMATLTDGPHSRMGVSFDPVNAVAGNINTDITIDGLRVIGTGTPWAAVYVAGGFDTSARSDNIRIEDVTSVDCLTATVYLNEGYYGSRGFVLGCFGDPADTLVSYTAGSWIVPPYIGEGPLNLSFMARMTHDATAKTTPVDADEIPLIDSAASNILKKLTIADFKVWWANLAVTLKNKIIDNTNSATLKDSSLVIQNAADTTKQAGFSIAGVTAGATVLYTMPASSQAIVGTQNSQNISGKTLVQCKIQSYTTAGRPAAATAGNMALIIDTTLNKLCWSDGTNWRDATGTVV